MSNPTPGTESSPLPTQPIVGVARVAVQNTNYAKSQLAAYRSEWPSPNDVTGMVDAADIKSTTGYFGGSLPDHSSHWGSYLNSMWQILPSGKSEGFVTNPDPSQLTSMVAQDPNIVTAGGVDPWHNLRVNFAKMWSKGAAPGTYKQSHP